MQPLPPITTKQILNGDLKDLLDDPDYDLTTMVQCYFIPVTSSM